MSLSSPHCITYKSLVISWQRQQRLIPCSQFYLSPTILFSCAGNECAHRLTWGQTRVQGIHPTHTSTKAPLVCWTWIIYSWMGSNQMVSGTTPSFQVLLWGWPPLNNSWAQLPHFRPPPPNSRFVPRGSRVLEKGSEVPCIKSVYFQGEREWLRPQPVCSRCAPRHWQLTVKPLHQAVLECPPKHRHMRIMARC